MKQYQRGLIIGKFLPPHAGHLAMIDFAKAQCESLNVLLGALAGESIAGPLRFEWLKESLRDRTGVTADYTDEELPTAAESSRDVSKVWAQWLKIRYPQADLIVSSEPYGEYLAQYMGIEHIAFDPPRASVPVSATMIRENPLGNWEHILPACRSFFCKRVCIYGPESTGKTIMTERLARAFNTAWVPEMARIYIGERKPQAEDIPIVARLHAQEIAKRAKEANRILLVDSDIITTSVYAKALFDKNFEFEDWVHAENRWDLHLLFYPDTPWVEDIQRDGGSQREFFYEWFKMELDQRGMPYQVIRGDWEQRFQACSQALIERWPTLETQFCYAQPKLDQ